MLFFGWLFSGFAFDLALASFRTGNGSYDITLANGAQSEEALPQSKVDVDPREVRKYIFDYFENHATAPLLEQIMAKFRFSRSEAFKLLAELELAHHIFLVPGTQRILMAWPFSGVTTPFKVTVAGHMKNYFANCALDAVAFHVMLRKEVRIESFCHHCGEEIRIQLKDQTRVSPDRNDDPLFYLSLPAAKMVGKHSPNLLKWCSSVRVNI